MTDSDCDSALTGRRRLLRLGLAGLVSAVAAPVPAAMAAPAVVAARGARTLAFQHLHTGESLRLAYWADGAYVPGALAELNHLLRDFRSGDTTAMDPRLFDLLHALAGKLDATRPFGIISGYRSPATNAMLRRASGGVARHSLHMDGMAIDIRLPGRRLVDVFRAARMLRAGGVGLYARSGFVHVDTGRVRFW